MRNMLQVGDEVQYIDSNGVVTNTRFVITSFDSDGSMNGIALDDTGLDAIKFCNKNPDHWHKTGKHFKEVEPLMEAMKRHYSRI